MGRSPSLHYRANGIPPSLSFLRPRGCSGGDVASCVPPMHREPEFVGHLGGIGDELVAPPTERHVPLNLPTHDLAPLGAVQLLVHVDGLAGAPLQLGLTFWEHLQEVLDEVPTLDHQGSAFLAHAPHFSSPSRMANKSFRSISCAFCRAHSFTRSTLACSSESSAC